MYQLRMNYLYSEYISLWILLVQALQTDFYHMVTKVMPQHVA